MTPRESGDLALGPSLRYARLMSSRLALPLAPVRCALFAFTVTALVTHASLAAAESGPTDDEAAAGDDDDDRPPQPSTPPLVSLGLGLGSMRLGDASTLAVFASDAGLGALSQFATLVEPTATLMLDRIVLPVRLRMASVSAGGQLTADSFGGSIGAGYRLLKRPDLVLYPAISLGIIETSLLVGESGDVSGAATFANFAATSGPATLSRVSVTCEATFDAEYRIGGSDKVEPRGVFIGGRVGITAPVARAPWTLEHRRTADVTSNGPSAPVAGPSLAVTVTARY